MLSVHPIVYFIIYSNVQKGTFLYLQVLRANTYTMRASIVLQKYKTGNRISTEYPAVCHGWLGQKH